MRKIRGTDDADWIHGTWRDEIIYGYAGDDFIDGEAGNDVIYGGDGADVLDGGAGDDRLVGGDGFDAANYQAAEAGVSVSLNSGFGYDGSGGLDSLEGIEAVLGSAFADEINGDAFDNELRGGAGDDGLFGEMGDDVLRGDEGDDTLAGGEGVDTADYFYARKAVTVDLMQQTGGGRSEGTDLLASIENVVGSRGSDTVAGSEVDNWLRGEAGNDGLYGREGDDDLWGGDGNDYLVGGKGDDELVGGEGRDTLLGGEGRDVLTGGAGADRFVFFATDIDGLREHADVITDFERGDRIDLSSIDAQAGTAGNDAFAFIGTRAFSGAAGELRYAVADGMTVIEGDVDGDRLADGYLVLDGVHQLAGRDFVL